MFQQQHFSFDSDFAENHGEHYIALNGLTQEKNIVVDVPVESVANREKENFTVRISKRSRFFTD